ncbi:NAD(P)-dependent alcohol dehydrogenase [Luteimonas fraxinea]|uniref:NAD(P)-dependent alcohol dehydrogenase n=1 Tax=Luteimonas fraxinea TaxID=2901869 RepID=A0ABS8UHQ9_9GAMM|nr:NAD(P)-dependent alcohol dehydrogenase [Luteimonas fraxinea]MCD9098193.1 NAD(P)-dependent alcohol dehydrogenase [Luteimonas fraxinea]MCD9126920.1 NAD(P)-dependent alcohol dehydrogenase [Luteimonas fraxinea]UHH08865.1 NAD(P)-dependent alcohol dehydrogenase [Luteimonas fraxinea]
MSETPAYAAADATTPLAPTTIQRRAPRANEVLIDIAFCGVCHSDLHQVRDEWGGSIFPMVPGHEIVGHVAEIGAGVTKFKVGDAVGVGCFVDSCRSCAQCQAGEEQFCEQGMTGTYNAMERDGSAPTYGGYSTRITVDQDYVLRVPESLPLDAAAPLLCAGITTYSPLRHFGVNAGDAVAVVGLGGLGHMAVKFAVAIGARVTVLSTSESKRDDALKLGAHDFAATRDEATFKTLAKTFDFIVDSVSAPHDYNAYLSLLKVDGTMILLGVPDQPAPVAAGALIMQRRRLTGSLIGGIRETQEMLDFCAEHGIVSDIERIGIADINTAYERMLKGDVRYRFVIDTATLKG